MKGATQRYGSDRLEFLLLSKGGHAPRTVAAEDERIAIYGMGEFTRLRMDDDEFAAQVAASFGQYGYGKVLIDNDGILRGLDVGHERLLSLLPAATSTPLPELEGFDVRASIGERRGGRPGLFNTSKTLTADLTTTVTIELSLPEGWHVYGAAESTLTPTRLTLDWTGEVVPGEVEFIGKRRGSGPDAWTERVELRLPVTVPEGTPVAKHLLHGEVHFVACDEEGCLPPVALPWHVLLPGL